jgi:signal transduction histidine kinase
VIDLAGHTATALQAHAAVAKLTEAHRYMDLMFSHFAHDAGRPVAELHQMMELLVDLPSAMTEDRQRLAYYLAEHLVHLVGTYVAPGSDSDVAASTVFSVADLFDRAVLVARGPYADRSSRVVITNRVPKDAMVCTSLTRFYVSLFNLVKNAMRWATTRVELRDEVRDGVYVLSIVDDGPGLAALKRGRGIEISERLLGHIGGGLRFAAGVWGSERAGLAAEMILPAMCRKGG